MILQLIADSRFLSEMFRLSLLLSASISTRWLVHTSNAASLHKALRSAGGTVPPATLAQEEEYYIYEYSKKKCEVDRGP